MSVPKSQSDAYQALKDQLEAKTSQLIEQCHVFYAFSEEQLKEGMAKHPIAEGEKYSRLFGGGFCPKKHAKPFLDGIEANHNWLIAEVEKAGLQEAEVLYHLCNHECFYTGDITDVIEVTDGRYSEDFIRKVYKENYPEDA